MDLGVYFKDFLNLLFPELCKACDDALYAHESVLCTDCLYHLPLTDYHLDSNNSAVQQLKGRFPFQFAICMLLMAKSSRVEKLIYQMKYDNHPEIGYYLGKQYASIIESFIKKQELDFIVPIPLHEKKLRMRGYNQSAYFAKGLSEGLKIPVLENNLIRIIHTISQTKKSSLERLDNVENAFQCLNPDKINGLHLLLVDDVLTTGATISEGAKALIHEGARVSIATIARA